VTTVVEAAAWFHVEIGVAQGRSPACSMAMVRRRWSFPSPQRPLAIGLGFGRWGTMTAANLVSSAVVPTSSIYGTARRGPTSRLLGWAAPIRTRVKGPVAVGPTGGDQY